ncbi:hypothetical protein C7271_05025 [filamentous cyanobacterium CCP5]|nr:hypothetical protein C7271_05025 [filamentous cyanobacterium CCP5]
MDHLCLAFWVLKGRLSQPIWGNCDQHPYPHSNRLNPVIAAQGRTGQEDIDYDEILRSQGFMASLGRRTGVKPEV